MASAASANVDLGSDGEVGLERPACLVVERDDPVLAAFTAHPQRADVAFVATYPRRQLDISQANGRALRLAEAGLQEQLEDGPVAHLELDRGHQPLVFALGEHSAFFPVPLRRQDLVGRGCREDPLLHQEAKERVDSGHIAPVRGSPQAAALPTIAAQLGAPRMAAPDTPMGATMGRPDDPGQQSLVLLASRRLLETTTGPGQIVHLAETYRTG
jgi:hypothetical protein